jgi:hypothetical protein
MMRRLHRVALVAALLAMCTSLGAACARCSRGGDAEAPVTTKASSTAPATGEPAAVPAQKAIYKSALDRARKEITADNAARRLEDMDAQIEREREMMR